MMAMANGGGSGGPGGRGPPGQEIDPNAMSGFKMMDSNGDGMVDNQEYIDFNRNMMGDSFDANMESAL